MLKKGKLIVSIAISVLAGYGVFFYNPLLSEPIPGYILEHHVGNKSYSNNNSVVVIDVHPLEFSGPSSSRKFEELLSRLLHANPAWISVAIFITPTGNATEDCRLIKTLGKNRISVANLAKNNSRAAIWESNQETCGTQVNSGYIDTAYNEAGEMIGIPYDPKSGELPLFLRTRDGVMGGKGSISKLAGEYFPVNGNIASLGLIHIPANRLLNDDSLRSLADKIIVIGSPENEHKIRTKYGIYDSSDIQANYIINAVRGNIEEVPLIIRLTLYLIFFIVTFVFTKKGKVRGAIVSLILLLLASCLFYEFINLGIYIQIIVLIWLSAAVAGSRISTSDEEKSDKGQSK